MFGVFTDVRNVKWAEYALALADVHPSDLDDAIADIRRSHAFRNAPLPAEIRARADIARKARLGAAQKEIAPPAPILTADGELRTFSLGGVSLTVRVLPDEHPALHRFGCLDCLDTGWRESAHKTPLGYDAVTRCGCITNNPVLRLARERQAERARQRDSRRRPEA